MEHTMDKNAHSLIARPLAQASHLIGLCAPSQVRVLGPHEKLDPASDWIIGIKPFSDGASLHDGHWERHPVGDEVLCLLDGEVRVLLRPQRRGEEAPVLELSAGQMLVVPRGCWHRLEAVQPGRLMFITPARGSEHEKVQP
ncbi:cupin domain-containing protein [Delftia acidovorans]|nr:cupin domain-containing protein [Delftia acidovorans]